MKNIHLLDTDKPSRLFYLASNLHLEEGQLISPKNYQHIYITSDEEIKDVRPQNGKWQLEKGQILNKFPDYLTDLSECKLVIMTTDQDLINDGVQAIDNEFLEWFVKNSSCEEIKIEKQIGCIDLDAVCDFGEGYCPYTPDCLKNKYKIIIPKEEPKQLFTKGDKVLFTGKMLDEEVIDKVVTVFYTLGRGKVEDMSDIMDEYSHIYRVWNKDLKHIPKEEPKQETLEEANWKVIGTKEDTFYNGAKWQQERMYSEEEVVQLLIKFNQEIQEVEDVRGWFEEFKKN